MFDGPLARLVRPCWPDASCAPAAASARSRCPPPARRGAVRAVRARLDGLPDRARACGRVVDVCLAVDVARTRAPRPSSSPSWRAASVAPPRSGGRAPAGGRGYARRPTIEHVLAHLAAPVARPAGTRRRGARPRVDLATSRRRAAPGAGASARCSARAVRRADRRRRACQRRCCRSRSRSTSRGRRPRHDPRTSGSSSRSPAPALAAVSGSPRETAAPAPAARAARRRAAAPTGGLRPLRAAARWSSASSRAASRATPSGAR